MNMSNVMDLPSSMTPTLAPADPAVAAWLAQVTLRLRRETAWAWHLQGQPIKPYDAQLPPTADPAIDSLDLNRYAEQKRRFFANDVAARYLSEEIERLACPPAGDGIWQKVQRSLSLNPAEQFLLALALAARLDAALGPVCAACQNDASRPFPTLALAQRLWDDPLAISFASDVTRPLFAYGLIAGGPIAGGAQWREPLEMPVMVARALAQPDAMLPMPFAPILRHPDARLPRSAEINAATMARDLPQRLQIIPLAGPTGAAFADSASLLAERSGRPVAALDAPHPPDRKTLAELATVAWLLGVDILLPEAWPERDSQGEPWFAGLTALPLRWYLPVADSANRSGLPGSLTRPAVTVPRLDYAGRAALLKEGLGLRGAGIHSAIDQVASHFRFERQTLGQVMDTLSAIPTAVSESQLLDACWNQASTAMGELAQPVTPRFGFADVVLPPKQQRQVEEIRTAMKTLATVHYRWGTARIWNEGGISALLYGPPGTGKTMTAEALANDLGMPMYRVDLSQVVNKYIGETEKNLKQLFDAAEAADCVLFFDEADALFGKRTEVKDAHDRFANIEISYLLERMERFKGLAILATNRRRDLDDAFTRRLRYIVEFPMPQAREREQIWRSSFPAGTDVSDLDFPFLAHSFEISGGHIRSAAFNACLQSAAEQPAPPRVSMRATLVALRRELEKMGRNANVGLFGAYATLIEEMP